MSQEATERGESEGFEGAVKGLSLADLIQLKGNNRFTGCISVEFGGRQGGIFFRDGEIIHAEKAGATGEEAFHRIMLWPGGRFTVLPKVTTTSHTIAQSLRYLLLESHRLMDERRRGAPPPRPKKEPERRGATLIESLKSLSDVTGAAYFDNSGMPAGATDPTSEHLAARGFLLASIGTRVGTILGLDSVTSATLEEAAGNLFVYAGKRHSLAVAATAAVQAEEVGESIRRILADARSGG